MDFRRLPFILFYFLKSKARKEGVNEFEILDREKKKRFVWNFMSSTGFPFIGKTIAICEKF